MEKVTAIQPRQDLGRGTCPTCQHNECGVCHATDSGLAFESPCSAWESRREVDGMTVWDVIAREG
jgi:hypothetical protein